MGEKQARLFTGVDLLRSGSGDNPIYTGWQQSRVRNAGLDCVNRGVAYACVTENQHLRKVSAKPVGRGSGCDFGEAFFCAQLAIGLNPLEASRVEEKVRVEIARGVQSQRNRLTPSHEPWRDVCLTNILTPHPGPLPVEGRGRNAVYLSVNRRGIEAADGAEMVHLEFRFLRSQDDFDDARRADQGRHTNRHWPVARHNDWPLKFH